MTKKKPDPNEVHRVRGIDALRGEFDGMWAKQSKEEPPAHAHSSYPTLVIDNETHLEATGLSRFEEAMWSREWLTDEPATPRTSFPEPIKPAGPAGPHRPYAPLGAGDGPPTITVLSLACKPIPELARPPVRPELRERLDVKLRMIGEGVGRSRPHVDKAGDKGNGAEPPKRSSPETRTDRPQVEVPDKDGELLPVMRLLDERLSTDEAEPPMRSVTGWPVEVRASEPMGMHELTASGANDAEEDADRLPAPKLYTLAPHTQYSLALMIERYVGFVKRIHKNGKTTEIPKRLPGVFVTHYLNNDRSRLPRVSALATMPVVLPNGRLLATNGLDRPRRTVFRIDPGIALLMPVGRVLGAEVVEAINFLTDEWLIDVQTDYSGKCVLIALALSIIERDLFGERPAFFVTAGKRGGGKTTALNMVALATLGKRAPAVPWSQSEEERRKSIFAALLQSVPLIVFDNIAAGSTLTCPVVEQALTASEMEDRVLGESRRERVSCSVILTFTGNNIRAKGDLASRSLMARLNVDRPDPENRAFSHPDPFGWTLDHRREIIAALYAILLGNPRLRQKSGGEKTRFKPWQRLVGSAIENAANLAGQGVDFAKLFQQVEEQDEEAASLADILQRLDRLAEDKPFRSAHVLTWGNADTADDAPTIKSFFGGSASRPLTAAGITRKLNSVADAPTMVGDAVWTLRAEKLPNGNLTQFTIGKRE